MDWLQAIILGIIQGLTEFIPISSTGHLYLGRNFFGLEEAGLYLDTMLHLGTLIALVVFYKDILLKLIKNPFSRITALLVIGTIPAVIAGVLFSDYFDSISKSGVTIGWEFLVTGAFLWFADSIKNGAKKVEDISLFDSFFIGSFQAFAIFPAISRSGMTIVGALMRKMDKEAAAYFSFLLSIPAICGGVIFQLKDMVSGNVPQISLTSMFIATLASAIFGYIAVKFMISFVKNKSLKLFAVYVWILGVVIIALQQMGTF
ncbi:undecaprenyl-diphosphate phosphatase [Metabacillus litoralis]|uniref:undecaprenyl-diphosphate phosphatase n=1 Tax=Metabacillus TaxID=2675233 RepID=UPI001B9FC870|nr:undecaprenyl-diphosphate phosphatase [Metabacillus litoralis]MCM3160131.1 undecaprenyl-diphosphate phosphatase [Metabacillus litoralis]MCM3408716.1 undecaprenyl-diphosphate phosphatase [Metabacillus litoralis]UHA59623.1 undecaprenyl-diphosphate phosphatase [Metabacillus litoralis]